MNETLVFPDWSGQNKGYRIFIVGAHAFLSVDSFLLFTFATRSDRRFDFSPYHLIQGIVFGALALVYLFYIIPMEKRSRTELTSESLRYIDHKGNITNEIALADVVKLTYHKGLFADKKWTVIAQGGNEMSFDQKLGRNAELVKAIEERTGQTFVTVDGEGRLLASS